MVARWIFDPWLCIIIILVDYFFAGIRGKYIALWIVPLFMIIFSFACLYLAIKDMENRNRHTSAMETEMQNPSSSPLPSTRGTEHRAGMPQAVLCALRIFAILIALIVGIYGEARYLREYHRLSKGASYHNVVPTEPAAGKFDATSIIFAGGSMINPDQIYGFIDKYSKTVFCLAPIVGPENITGPQKIHYWATGINCCEPRQHFHCGQVTDDKATGAVRLTKVDRYDYRFIKAVRAAEKEYGLQRNDMYLLLDVVEDPVGYRKSLYNKTGILYIIFGGAYFMVLLLLGLGLDSACVGIPP